MQMSHQPYVARIEVDDDSLRDDGGNKQSYHEVNRAKIADMFAFIAMHTNAVANED
jgi:hypothetical protein